MAYLSISLLGTIQITVGGRPVTSGAYAKALALLAYLAVEADRPHTRAALAALFWPDQPEENARHSLRQALSTVRRVLASPVDNTGYLVAGRDAVQFNREADSALDVRQMLDLAAACRSHDHHRLETCPTCAQRLQALAAAYRGEFLQGFAIEDSAEFEDWIVTWRQRLAHEAIWAGTALVAWHEHRGALDEAASAAGRLIQLDPWHEPAHRHLMDLLWRQGKRAEALAQYERCRRVLEEELGVPPDDETTALYALISASGAGEHRAPRPAGRGRHASRLPSPPGRLVGRERDLESIADLLARRDCRLLTLAGPGGIGKTRLGLEAAREHARHTAEHTAFISFAAGTDAAAIVPAIAGALGLTLVGTMKPAHQVRDWLRDRSVFLMLDNVENVVDGIEVLSGLIESAPDVTFLATSRQRLDLRGEWVYEVGGLDVPASAETDSAEGYGAFELFAERLRQVRPRTPLQPGERPAVIRICQLVDGMPLAIELAAAWASSQTLERIADEMQRNLDFLSTTMRDVPDRHRSMRAVFNQTWSMLSEDERQSFQKLTAFHDGFAPEAAGPVAGTTPQQLSGLVAKSLLSQQANGRYRLHGLLRQFGTEVAEQDAGAHHDLGERHSLYYLTLLASLETDLTGQNQQVALDVIEQDIGNIRAAWRWAISNRCWPRVVAAQHALWLFHVIRGWMREGRDAFEAVRDANDRSALAGTGGSEEMRLAWANALCRAGGFQSGLGRYDEGIAMLEEGIAQLEEVGAARDLGLALNMLAAAKVMKGDLDDAREVLHRSLVQFSAVDDAWGIAYSLNDLGLTAHLMGDDVDAERHCADSRTRLHAIGDRRGSAFAAYNLGMIAARAGDHLRARRLYRESLALRQDSHDQWGTAASLVRLGNEARTLGAPQEARAMHLKALRIGWDSSISPVVLDALAGLAELQADDGEVDQARELLAAIRAHPAAPGHVRNRIDGAGRPEDTDVADPFWATRTVETAARSLVG